MILQTPAVISKISTMANRSLRFQVDSQEGLTDEQMGKFTALHEKFGHFVFSPDIVREEDLLDLPPLPKDDSTKKTPGQQFRDRLFVYYMNTHTEKDKFNAWYMDTLEKLGQQYLAKIDNN